MIILFWIIPFLYRALPCRANFSLGKKQTWTEVLSYSKPFLYKLQSCLFILMKRNYMDERMWIFQHSKLHYLGIIMKAVNLHLIQWFSWQEKKTEPTEKPKQTNLPQQNNNKKSQTKNRERKNPQCPHHYS